MAVSLGEAQSPRAGIVYVDINLGLNYEIGPEGFTSVRLGLGQVPQVVSCTMKSAAQGGIFTLRLAANGLTSELRGQIIRKAERLVQTAV